MKAIILIGALSMGVQVGCASAPRTESQQDRLEARADATVRMMRERDPGLAGILERSAGYVVFPEIGKGGFVVGAAHGQGVLYEGGRFSGYVTLNQGAVGALAGGQSFSELIVFRDEFLIDKLKTGSFSLGANVSAVALTSGAAASTSFTDGTAVFVVPRGGMMAELSISGQQLDFTPGT